MSKYLILILINLPLVIAGVLSTISAYKTKQVSRRRMRWSLLFWVFIFIGLMLIEPIYDILVRSNLTDSSPLSIFDIILLTMILFTLFLLKRSNEASMRLGHRMARLQENLAISEEERTTKR